MYNLAAPFIILIFLLSPFTSAVAEIVVFDDVTSVNKSIRFNAVTKGKFLIEGGRLVKFYVDGKSLGTNLSGGDGYAFFTYTPSIAGIFKLKAESGNDTDEGAFLVTAKSDRVLLIEMELIYETFPFSFEPAKDSPGVLQRLSKNFRIVYLTTMAGIEVSRKAVRENNLPISPVLKWEGSSFLDELKERGITPYAIVASPGVISEASDIQKRYSFEETEDGTELRDWNDLIKQLELKNADIVQPDN